MLEPKKDEIWGGWRKLHNEELHNLYSSPSIIRVIKLRRMRWTGHVARMGDKRITYRIWWDNKCLSGVCSTLGSYFGVPGFKTQPWGNTPWLKCLVIVPSLSRSGTDFNWANNASFHFNSNTFSTNNSMLLTASLKYTIKVKLSL
jgi:hypothetical protein